MWCHPDQLAGIGYSLYADAADLEADYGVLESSFEIVADLGDCQAGKSGESSWTRSDREGRVMCTTSWTVTKAPYLAWSDTSALVLGVTKGPPSVADLDARWRSGEFDPAIVDPAAVDLSTRSKVVRIAATDQKFDQQSLQVPAWTPFTLRFTNNDAGVRHSIRITETDGTDPVFVGEAVTGETTIDYHAPPLYEGVDYTFSCDIHPTMTGTLSAAE
jgi:plastocyanin